MWFTPELARQVLAVATLSVGSYLDIRYRKVGDAVWLVSGAACAALGVLFPSNGVLASAALGGMFGCACLATGTFRQGDFFCTLVLCATLPGLGVISSVAGLLAAAFCAVCANVACNLSEIWRGTLFEGTSEGRARRTLAFFVMHRRRGDRFASRAQYGEKLVFWGRLGDAAGEGYRGYVYWKVPIIPFVLALLVFFSTLS